MTDYTKLLERLAIERYAYSFGSPSDQEIAVELLASMAVNHIPSLVETVKALRAEVPQLIPSRAGVLSAERLQEMRDHYAPAQSVDFASAAIVELLDEVERLGQIIDTPFPWCECSARSANECCCSAGGL